MGCGAAEATGLGFVCFVVINPRVLSANRVDFGLSCFINFSISSGGWTLQRLARACFCFCVFVIWLLSSLSVGCSLLVFFLFVWSFRLFGS